MHDFKVDQFYRITTGAIIKIKAVDHLLTPTGSEKLVIFQFVNSPLTEGIVPPDKALLFTRHVDFAINWTRVQFEDVAEEIARG